MKLIRSSIIVLLLTLSLFACGRKSQPKPPEERAPAPVREAKIEPRSSSLVLKWKAPIETASGDEILYLDTFDVLRKVNRKNVSPDYREIAVINVKEDEVSDFEYQFEDREVELGTVYEYLIVPRDGEGIEGVPQLSLRVSFLGAGSLVESIPFVVEGEEDTK